MLAQACKIKYVYSKCTFNFYVLVVIMIDASLKGNYTLPNIIALREYANENEEYYFNSQMRVS